MKKIQYQYYFLLTDADTIYRSKVFTNMLKENNIRQEIVSVQSKKTSLC